MSEATRHGRENEGRAKEPAIFQNRTEVDNGCADGKEADDESGGDGWL